VMKKVIVKKNSLEAYSRPRINGINAITVREGDQLLEAKLTDGKSEIMIASLSGKAIRFEDEKVRPMGRTASGVRGINLGTEDNEVIGMIVIRDKENETVLVVSEKGYGKRSSIEDYRITNRGGKGVTTLNVTEKTGKLIAIQSVTDNDDLMIINKSGVTIRTGVSEMRVMGRATQGVRLINLKKNDEIAAVAKVAMEEEVEMDEEIDAENDLLNHIDQTTNVADIDNEADENLNLDTDTDE